VLFLDLKFCKNLGFFLSEHCVWGTRGASPQKGPTLLSDLVDEDYDLDYIEGYLSFQQ
jgi:hypothetical protein